jgi:hypothetical protein
MDLHVQYQAAYDVFLLAIYTRQASRGSAPIASRCWTVLHVYAARWQSTEPAITVHGGVEEHAAVHCELDNTPPASHKAVPELRDTVCIPCRHHIRMAKWSVEGLDGMFPIWQCSMHPASHQSSNMPARLLWRHGSMRQALAYSLPGPCMVG